MNSYEFKVVCDYELLLGFYPPVNVYMWETHHECRSCSSRKHGFSSAIFVSPHYMFCLTCILDGPWNMFFKTSLGFQVPSNNSLNISGFTIYTRWAGWHQGEKQWNPIETLALSEFGLVFQSIDIFTGKKRAFNHQKLGVFPSIFRRFHVRPHWPLSNTLQ